MSKVIKAEDWIRLPREVAVCPICKSTLFASFDSWVEENGQWKASSVNLDCETEPDIDSDDWWDWHNAHYSMPYVDWLPVEHHVKEWINEN